MKKLLFMLFLIPAVAFAECDCDEDEYYDEDAPYMQYSYWGVQYGSTNYPSSISVSNGELVGLTYGHRSSELVATELRYVKPGSPDVMTGANFEVHYWRNSSIPRLRSDPSR